MHHKIIFALLLLVLSNTSCKSRKKQPITEHAYENGWKVVSATIVVEDTVVLSPDLLNDF